MVLKFDKIQGHFLLEPLGDCNLSKYRIDQVASIFRWAKGIRYNPRKIDYEHSFGAMPLQKKNLKNIRGKLQEDNGINHEDVT